SPHEQIAGNARDRADHDGVAADDDARTAMPPEQQLWQIGNLGWRGETAPVIQRARQVDGLTRAEDQRHGSASGRQLRLPVRGPWAIPAANAMRRAQLGGACSQFYPLHRKTPSRRGRMPPGMGSWQPDRLRYR